VSALIIHIRTFPAPMLVTVEGEIDLATAPQLRERVFQLPEDDLVLDTSRVRLFAAAGLGVLLELQDRRARTGAQLVLAAPSAAVRRVLCVTRLDKTLAVAATVEDAVALLTAAAHKDSGNPRTGTNGHNPASSLPSRPLPRSSRQHGEA
jgi:anti-sigma B factor antagonist